jgi:hypothetical protein
MHGLRGRVPAKLQRRGRLLLNQQCWVWGQDVRREEGNLLLEYGFERRRAEDGSSASSQYTLKTSDGACLRLWGYGFYFGSLEGEGIYLNRFEYMPRVAVSDGDRWHGVSEFEGLAVAGDTVLLESAMRAIAGYERWVLKSCGLRYRLGCLAGWTKRQVAPVVVADEWARLARSLEVLRGGPIAQDSGVALH